MQRHDYYVYVYIDPRNHEEFYYGKGRGSRKAAHLNDKSDSDKAKRIADIRKDGLDPIIRVIARGLTQAEALLVEKTLLWKLGKWTLNIARDISPKNSAPTTRSTRNFPVLIFRTASITTTSARTNFATGMITEDSTSFLPDTDVDIVMRCSPLMRAMFLLRI